MAVFMAFAMIKPMENNVRCELRHTQGVHVTVLLRQGHLHLTPSCRSWGRREGTTDHGVTLLPLAGKPHERAGRKLKYVLGNVLAFKCGSYPVALSSNHCVIQSQVKTLSPLPSGRLPICMLLPASWVQQGRCEPGRSEPEVGPLLAARCPSGESSIKTVLTKPTRLLPSSDQACLRVTMRLLPQGGAVLGPEATHCGTDLSNFHSLSQSAHWHQALWCLGRPHRSSGRWAGISPLLHL